MQDQNRRERFKPFPLTLKYSLILTVMVGFLLLVSAFVMAWFIQRNYSLFTGEELGLSLEVVEVIRKEQRLLETSLSLLFLISLVVTFVMSFFVIQKISGPIQAMRRQLWLYARGDWSRAFKLRRNDEFKELEKLINTIRENHLHQDQEAV